MPLRHFCKGIDGNILFCYNLSMKYKRQLAAAMEFLLIVTGTIIAVTYDAAKNEQSQTFRDIVPLLCTAALIMLALIVLIEIMACIKLEGSTYHTVLIAVALMLYFICSTDTASVFEMIGLYFHPPVAEIFSFVFFECIIISVFYFFNYLYKPQIKPAFVILTICICAFTLISFILLQDRRLQYIPLFTFAAYSLIFFAWLSHRIVRLKKDDFTFYMTSFILCAVYGAQIVYVLDKSELISVTTSGYSVVYIFFVILVFIIIYFLFIIRTTFQASEYKLRVNTLKSEILREQIKPHFIFNSLTTIKSLYHKDLSEGDHAISLFSRHLRSNVEAADTDLIPFERELDNIQNYIELENTKYDRKFTVIYNIDVTEFYVPVLSLQPFVENAIKYSKVNCLEDGYIEISSSESGGEILLEISDNGAGFDESDIKPNSCGIRNSRERFKILMNATIDIQSRKGEGTRVTIHIKKPEVAAIKPPEPES